MSGDSEVLRSFLVSLGYVIKHDQQKNFENSLDKTTKLAERTGFAIAGIAIAAQAMVKSYANSMESLYYASQRTGSTIQGIQALQSGAERVGVSAETALGQLEAMSEALNLNPGKRALLESLTGGKTKGMTNEKAMIELLRELKTLPDNIGFGYAQMFGIGDYKSYKNMTNNLRDMEEGIRKREQVNKNLGVDPDKQKEAWRQYSNSLKDINDQLSVVGLKIATGLLPVFSNLSKTIGSIVKDIDKMSKQFSAFEEVATEKAGAVASFAHRALKSIGIDTNAKPGTVVVKKPTQEQAIYKKKYLSDLEKKYGLPAGVLDSMWEQESGRGKNTYNAKSKAAGDFQFIPSTQKEFGVKNPYDFYEESDAAARKLKGQLKHYNNDIKMALSAYNYGEGNLSKSGYLGVPRETRDYRDQITGRMQQITLNQKTDIHVNGANDPKAVADEIKRYQQQDNAEAIRNMQAKLK